MTSSSADPSNLTTIAAVAALTAFVGWMVTKGDEGTKHKRRWSLMSDNMAQGTFPPKAKFDEAIINVVMVFDDSDSPTVDQVVNRCVKLLLQYERFSSVYNRTTSTASYCGDTLDPYDLVREIQVSDCSLDSDLLKVMEGEACVPLAQAPRGTMLPWWEFVLLTNTNSTKKTDGKSAVIWRIHHGLGKTKHNTNFGHNQRSRFFVIAVISHYRCFIAMIGFEIRILIKAMEFLW